MVSVDAAGGKVFGAWDRPHNAARDRVGSIHDDSKAKELGFRGAFVSARTHLVLFSPVLLESFGPRWFERGVISMEFRIGTLDREPVRAVVTTSAEPGRPNAWLEDEQGRQIACGTVCLGRPTGPTWLDRKDLLRGDEGKPYQRIGHIRPGQTFPAVDLVITPEQASRYVQAIETGLDWYAGPSPWGGPIASHGSMVTAMGAPCSAYLADNPVGAVAIDGAIELRNVAGPVLLNRDYRASGEVVGRGRSPRTEYIWYESRLDDASGVRVAEMRMQLRFVVA